VQVELVGNAPVEIAEVVPLHRLQHPDIYLRQMVAHHLSMRSLLQAEAKAAFTAVAPAVMEVPVAVVQQQVDLVEPQLFQAQIILEILAVPQMVLAVVVAVALVK
jgi:hypothetical protein